MSGKGASVPTASQKQDGYDQSAQPHKVQKSVMDQRCSASDLILGANIGACLLGTMLLVTAKSCAVPSLGGFAALLSSGTAIGGVAILGLTLMLIVAAVFIAWAVMKIASCKAPQQTPMLADQSMSVS